MASTILVGSPFVLLEDIDFVEQHYVGDLGLFYEEMGYGGIVVGGLSHLVASCSFGFLHNVFEYVRWCVPVGIDFCVGQDGVVLVGV